jgi:ketosteroid isomerase-like protein
MSQENVEIVRAVYERWERGDFRATLDMLDAHVVLVLGPEFPEAGTYFGIEAVSEYTRACWSRSRISRWRRRRSFPRKGACW